MLSTTCPVTPVVLVATAVLLAGCGTRLEGSGPLAVPEEAPASPGAAEDPAHDEDDGAADETPTETAEPSDDTDDTEGGEQAATPEQAAEDSRVLSPCSPPAGTRVETLVEATGPRPPLREMEDALTDSPDLRMLVDQHVEAGVARQDAVHAMYAQVVGDVLLEDARTLPGFVAGAYGSPLDREPFRLVFEDELPDGFDPTRHPLGSYGLVVSTGVPGPDVEGFDAAYAAAVDLGLRVMSGSIDEFTGTGTIEVLRATPEQVAAWEAVVEQPDRVCLVRAEPSVRCDEEVVAAAREEAERQGEVIEGGTASREAAEAVRRSHLGLPTEDSRDKAGAEGRRWRLVVEDGVGLSVTMDLAPGRLNVTSCLGVVVDAQLEGVDG